MLINSVIETIDPWQWRFTEDYRTNSAAIMAMIMLATLPMLARGAPDAVQYELQERCGRHAAETFRRERKTNLVKDKDGQTLANYRSHYSPKLNKCFYLEMSNHWAPGKTNQPPTDLLRLYDLHENKEYGTYFDGGGGTLLNCVVVGKKCASKGEWERLIAPYMEE